MKKELRPVYIADDLTEHRTPEACISHERLKEIQVLIDNRYAGDGEYRIPELVSDILIWAEGMAPMGRAYILTNSDAPACIMGVFSDKQKVHDSMKTYSMGVHRKFVTESLASFMEGDVDDPFIRVEMSDGSWFNIEQVTLNVDVPDYPR